MRRTARTAADGVGAREWLEMGGEKKPLVMSDLGCADGCGREMGAETARTASLGRDSMGHNKGGNSLGRSFAGRERDSMAGRRGNRANSL